MKIIISIVSHGQAKLVTDLLLSLDKFVVTSDHNVEIFITENLDSDERYSSDKFPVFYSMNLRKKGFGENHNAVFEKRKCDFFFVVNPDIRFTQIFNLDKLINSLIMRNIDISSPEILKPNGDVEDYRRSNLTIKNLIKRMFFKSYEEKFEWFAGMFLIFRSECFGKLKGFDTDYFMYVEDCDLCMRARNHGMILEDSFDFSVVHDAQRMSRRNVQHFRWHLTSLLKYWSYKRFVKS